MLNPALGKLSSLQSHVPLHTDLTVGPLGENPVQVACPQCHQTVLTELEYLPGLLTYLSCGGICLIGCAFGCCLIPFLVDRLKDAKHNCPNCKTVLGVHKRI
ncbi:lipopolysaccharide-induced tumor necrosis factor-alpha factor homolog [Sebastes umbrosus]|uniref:lipopolysaccharide-induced tumor necrosis factor-alpha factor homolog n=1 Tax=Sebastes umbrosus TaxID=72105 RepID=UPI00189DB968|nr:lipopolysaccharide-induced tumor necrosis factor-alpha factor homolog [Sebastes umbrosus]